MDQATSLFRIRPLTVALAFAAVAAAPSAQVGRPLNTLEVSDTAGGLENQLSWNGSFGSSVAAAGDLDGDGIMDMIAGAPRDFGTGALWVLFLNANGSVRAARKTDVTTGTLCLTPADRDDFGWAVAALGDLDGDGTSEIAVSLPFRDGLETDEGRVLILSIAPTGDVVACTQIGTGLGGFGGILEFREEFGTSLACIGDLDGDGIPELAVGSPEWGIAGGVWILFLQPDGTVRDEIFLSEGRGGFTGDLSTGDDFGGALAPVGDVDGDGVPDLAVGAPGTSPLSSGVDTGKLWILELSPNGMAQGHTEIETGAGGFDGPLVAGDGFGGGLAGLPDLDGNGVRDLLVGFPDFDEFPMADSGGYWLLLLAPGGSVLSETKVLGSEMPGAYRSFSFNELGTAMAYLGDLDGDGSPTIAFGTPGLQPVLSGEVWMAEIQDADPLPAFSAQASTTGASPLTVSFVDESTGTGLTDWSWDFGDGQSSSSASPTHTFYKVGTYDVTLTVTGADGTNTITQEGFVVVDSALAQATERNGSGINADVLDFLSLPILGSTWNAEVDATLLGASGFVLLVAYEDGHAGIPTPFGELLLDPSSRLLATDAMVLVANKSTHAIPLSNDLALLGCPASVQALVPSTPLQLSNALDLVLGL